MEMTDNNASGGAVSHQYCTVADLGKDGISRRGFTRAALGGLTASMLPRPADLFAATIVGESLAVDVEGQKFTLSGLANQDPFSQLAAKVFLQVRAMSSAYGLGINKDIKIQNGATEFDCKCPFDSIKAKLKITSLPVAVLSREQALLHLITSVFLAAHTHGDGFEDEDGFARAQAEFLAGQSSYKDLPRSNGFRSFGAKLSNFIVAKAKAGRGQVVTLARYFGEDYVDHSEYYRRKQNIPLTFTVPDALNRINWLATVEMRGTDPRSLENVIFKKGFTEYIDAFVEVALSPRTLDLRFLRRIGGDDYSWEIDAQNNSRLAATGSALAFMIGAGNLPAVRVFISKTNAAQLPSYLFEYAKDRHVEVPSVALNPQGSDQVVPVDAGRSGSKFSAGADFHQALMLSYGAHTAQQLPATSGVVFHENLDSLRRKGHVIQHNPYGAKQINVNGISPSRMGWSWRWLWYG